MSAVVAINTGKLVRAREAYAAALEQAHRYGYGKIASIALAAEAKARALDGYGVDAAVRAVVKPKHCRVFDPPPEAA